MQEPLIKTLLNKIGNLLTNGITESSLSEAIKNDRTTITSHTSQLADITTNKLPLKANQLDLNTTNANVAIHTTQIAANTTAITNIGNASPKGTYATLTALQTAFPTGATGIYVVSADGNWYYWNGSAWTIGGVYQSTGSSNFLATNIVPNSDFNAGTTGGWTASSSTNSVASKVLTNTADGTANYGLVVNYLSNLVVGHKYYFRGKVKATNSSSTYLRIKLNNSSELQYTTNNPVVNTVYDISGIFTVTSTTSALNFMHGYADNATANGKAMELQYVLGVDLTNTFGSGNEPSATEMDKIMLRYTNSWFSGTISPLLNYSDLYDYFAKFKNSNSGMLVQTGSNTYTSRTLTGTANQINISNGDGVGGNPTISIPTGASGIFTPATPTASYGSELAPTISTWTGTGGATWNGTAWAIPTYGTLKTNIAVEQGAEYEIDITWTNTNSYDSSTPQLIVSLGSVVSDPQFTGYSDALYKLTLISNTTGTVELKLGDGTQAWSATITNISVKKILSKVSKAGRIGIGAYDIYTGSTNLAIGGGHVERTTGTDNHAYGYKAQSKVTTGLYNTAMGSYAQENLTTGLNNVALGYTAQRYLKTGYYNIGIGYAAQVGLTYGSWNIAIGNESQRDLTTGEKNTSVGSRALNSLTTGSNNVAMGRQAGFYPKAINNPTTTANNQVTIGMQSGQSDSNPADNLTALGFQAIGAKNATAVGSKTEAKGIGSVAIGLDSDGNFAQATQDNEFVLGTTRHNVKVKGTLNITQYTPTSSSDTKGQVGDITSDDNYVYVKTSTGWKRSALSTW